MNNLEELLFQEVMWRQKSKALWAKEGDNNTRMFHSIVNGRKNRYLIKSWNLGKETLLKKILAQKLK